MSRAEPSPEPASGGPSDSAGAAESGPAGGAAAEPPGGVAAEPAGGLPVGAAPDPLRGFRGPVSAAVVLEVITVLLTLLVVAKFGGTNGGALGIGLVVVLAGALVGLLRYAARPWAATAGLALQGLLLLGGFLVGVLAVLGVLFGLVWLALVMMRRDVAGKLARGELPAQQHP